MNSDAAWGSAPQAAGIPADRVVVPRYCVPGAREGMADWEGRHYFSTYSVGRS